MTATHTSLPMKQRSSRTPNKMLLFSTKVNFTINNFVCFILLPSSNFFPYSIPGYHQHIEEWGEQNGNADQLEDRIEISVSLYTKQESNENHFLTLSRSHNSQSSRCIVEAATTRKHPRHTKPPCWDELIYRAEIFM